MTAPDTDLDFWIEHAQRPFSGWDFAEIEAIGRMAGAPLAWSYASIVLPHLRAADWLLDMGTGGGEFLSRLQPLPPHTCATEAYPPNISIAQQRLGPLSVQVFAVDENGLLPFASDAFDLIINRHEFYLPEEGFRVLKPGCLFITQQVGGQNDLDINRALDAPLDVEWASWSLATAAAQLESAGFEILDRREDFPLMRLYDIGAVIYYLKAVPWQIPDFSVETYRDQLARLHDRIKEQGVFDVGGHRFLLVARKP